MKFFKLLQAVWSSAGLSGLANMFVCLDYFQCLEGTDERVKHLQLEIKMKSNRSWFRSIVLR